MAKKSVLLVILFVISSLFLSSVEAGTEQGEGGFLIAFPEGITPRLDRFTELLCDDRGVLSFHKIPKFKIINATRLSDGKLIDNIEGSWREDTFTSEEATLIKRGYYELTEEEEHGGMVREVFCPGLKFSCRVVRLEINSCSNKQGIFNAELMVVNTTPDDLKYSFGIRGKTLTYQKEKRSPEIKNLTVNKIGSNTYNITLQINKNITNLQINHPECVGKYYVLDKKDCTTQVEEVPLEKVFPPEQIKPKEEVEEIPTEIEVIEEPKEEQEEVTKVPELYPLILFIAILLIILLYIFYSKKK